MVFVVDENLERRGASFQVTGNHRVYKADGFVSEPRLWRLGAHQAILCDDRMWGEGDP